ncbi:MbtH family protein [Nocardia callitridis]|uniref:MbtH-like domain-containing protein n=1 Tax=Nocardia callitridis TaxID=648753 RepID=A0ABP9JTY6_9NOCA
MTNPFDDDSAKFYVLVNRDGEHCLWPIFGAVPGGWTVAYGAADRKSCLHYVEVHWQDMRPTSLIEERSGLRVATDSPVLSAAISSPTVPGRVADTAVPSEAEA